MSDTYYPKDGMSIPFSISSIFMSIHFVPVKQPFPSEDHRLAKLLLNLPWDVLLMILGYLDLRALKGIASCVDCLKVAGHCYLPTNLVGVVMKARVA